MTRDEILNLKVGDKLQATNDTCYGKALPGAFWQKEREIVEIYAQGVSEWTGKAYICFYCDFGTGTRVSGSLQEGEEFYKLAQSPVYSVGYCTTCGDGSHLKLGKCYNCRPENQPA